MDRQTESYTATSRNDGGSRGVHPPQDKGKLMRNKRPCGRCSKSQRKCDIEPLYSSALCRQCAKAGLSECPPYEPRKKASTDDHASRSSPTNSTSSHDGGIHGGPAVQHSRQHSGVDTDAVFLTLPTQITQGPAATLTAYTPTSPIPPLSVGLIQPSPSLNDYGSLGDWRDSVGTAPNLMHSANVPVFAQRQPIPFDGQWGLWGVSHGGAYTASTTYQTPPAPHGMPYP